jgi:hypothetical protein
MFGDFSKFHSWKNETVLLIDLPLPQHERAIAAITDQFERQKTNVPTAHNLLESRSVSTCRFSKTTFLLLNNVICLISYSILLFQATNIGKEADISFQPRDKPRPTQGQGCDALV